MRRMAAVNIVTLKPSSFHDVYLEPFTGVGIIVLPRAEENVWLGEDGYARGDSVHDAALTEVLRGLDAMGLELLLNDQDFNEPITDGITPDGREALALYTRDPLIAEQSLNEIHEAQQALWSHAGLTIGATPQ